MTHLCPFWQRYSTALLIVTALVAGLIWGINLGREMGPVPLPTPSGEYVEEIPPGGKLELELEPPLPGQAPPDNPRLTVRVDIRDGLSGRPVRGDVWLAVVKDLESEDILIREGTSLVEFELPEASEADYVMVKVQAEGYLLWSLGVRHQIEFDRVLPLEVRLEPLRGGVG
jgi:hypothetical protein